MQHDKALILQIMTDPLQLGVSSERRRAFALAVINVAEQAMHECDLAGLYNLHEQLGKLYVQYDNEAQLGGTNTLDLGEYVGLIIDIVQAGAGQEAATAAWLKDYHERLI